MNPWIRIALRYGSGMLVTAGYLTPDDATFLLTDPDVIMIIGAAVGALTEFWYILADRYGWRK